MSSAGGYQRIPPSPPASLDQNATGDVSFPASVVLPNAASTSANLLHLGPLNSNGLRLTRPSSQFLQIANGDSSANATVGAAYYRLMVDGGSGSPGYASQSQPTYGLYVNNSGPYSCLVGAGNIGVRVNLVGQANVRWPCVSRASALSPAAADTGTIYDNFTASAQIVFTLSNGQPGHQLTFINQNTAAGAAGLKIALSSSSDRIVYNGTLGAAGPTGNLVSASVYATAVMVYTNAGTWHVVSSTGSWTLT